MVASALQSLFAPAALAELRAHPGFEAAVDDLAKASLQVFAEADETGRWMFRDLGRSSLYLAAVILDSTADGLTAAALAAFARGGQTASRGRVMDFIHRAQEADELAVTPGSGPWTRRRLILKAPFIDRFRRGNRVYVEAVSGLAPDIAHLPTRLDDDVFFRKFAVSVGLASQAAASAGGLTAGERVFLDRDRGGSILFRLMTSQPRPRARLLQEALLSRSRLSREFGVSRVHINRLLSDAEALGLLSCPAPDRVVFSERLSDDVGRMMTVTLQITRAALLSAEALTAE